ncbi:ABC transporter permease [Bifidobacterium crudilactis]|jgi:ABC-type sugar transport system permease subunit|uniref:Sugar ABC transporter permease n=1 Tax=Bifidobacterium crudilactis TaxID=327277 RepID=A0A971CXE5_9BIFI|nr:sugar ABC transporter permease [Bifidobacterium crudilactis]MCI1661270.1 sugar ABC transporter permease [Bifidobacterium psychraerophilum]MCI1868845.1 sugar ABC transporter permease [Bifidobacterium crudilactis]MDN5973011.1 sugar ABC transporter permease [Bifidobacterium crudilactis]MDN6000997.1 sugar ABC transporter permease [Bifidobacterium crudilactis]MDN6209177.1 sugar ABC transporter permease [Bifidobacterium crudilactis]
MSSTRQQERAKMAPRPSNAPLHGSDADHGNDASAQNTGSYEKSQSRKRGIIGFMMAMPPIVVLVLFVGAPVVLAILFSLGYTGGLNQIAAEIGTNVHQGSPLSIGAYLDIFQDSRFIRDLLVTLVVTIVGTAAVILITTSIAVFMRMSRSKAGGLLAGLAVIPLFIPVVIASWANLIFYQPNGFLRSLFAQFGIQAPIWGFTTIGVIIASVWVNLPFSMLMTISGFQSVPDDLIDGARDAGASTFRIVCEILLPLARPQMLIATTLTAIGILGQFTVPYFIGPNAPTMLGVDIAKYYQSFNRPQQSVAIAVVMFIIGIGIAVTYIVTSVRGDDDAAKE